MPLASVFHVHAFDRWFEWFDVDNWQSIDAAQDGIPFWLIVEHILQILLNINKRK